MSNIINITDCCDTNGGDKYYAMTFSSAISFTILATTHLIGRVPDIKIYKSNGLNYEDKIMAHEQVAANLDVTITFKQPQTGIIILT